jgi:predicted amidophosphoribosyltransferase
MYCSSCGSAIPPNLSYCKICGTKLSVATDSLPEVPANSFPESLVFGMVATLVFGTGVIMGLMAVMSKGRI